MLGSFHQGDTRFGATVGVQCTSNSLLALRWSKIRDCIIWRKDDLDHVLNEGDQLYKSLNTTYLLLVDDLSRTLKLFNMDISIKFLHLETRDVALADGLPFSRCCVPHNICDGFLSFVGGNSTAIVPKENKFYLFDSHSCDGRGFCVSDGTSVLLRFRNLSEVERYIQVAYLEFRDIQGLYFQLQFIKIDITPRIKSAITLSYNRIRKSYQKKE